MLFRLNDVFQRRSTNGATLTSLRQILEVVSTMQDIPHDVVAWVSAILDTTLARTTSVYKEEADIVVSFLAVPGLPEEMHERYDSSPKGKITIRVDVSKASSNSFVPISQTRRSLLLFW